MSENDVLASGVGNDLTNLLRKQIMSGSLAARERLFPKDLQERYGVSHIPIREALRTLAAEGLVIYEPRKGAKVSGLSRSQLEEVYRLRRCLEPPVAKRSAEARSAFHLEAARRAYDLMEESGTADIEIFLPRHASFHWALLDVDLGPLTRSLLQQTSNIAERYVRLGFTAFHLDDRAHRDHAALMAAFEDRDGDEMASVLDRHLRLVENTLTEYIGSASLESV